MGLYRIEIEATGGHGCQREKKEGEQVFHCNRSNCPDCLTMDFVESLRRINQHVSKAEFTHWPNAAEWGSAPIRETIVPSAQEAMTGKNTDGSEYKYVWTMYAHRIRHGNF
jgi:hypothetical protein